MRPDSGTRFRTITIADPVRPFVTEHRESIPHVELAFESWGRLNERRDNAVLVIHALTGDAHVASHPDIPGDREGWWEGIVGPGRAIDTDRYFVICANSLGSCYGSTGPCSTAPDGKRYNLRFSRLTVRDLVAAQIQLLDQLGIERLAAAIGGSLGGMQVLELAAMAPERVGQAIAIAATTRFHAQGIAFNEIQRRSIMLDPAWRSGEYREGEGPDAGIALARMVGMLTYQSDALMAARFDRNPARYDRWFEFQERYDVEGYLHYQGDKLARRFDANSYLYLSRVMDSQDLGRNRGGVLEAARRITARCLLIGISSDILFPASLVRGDCETLRQAAVSATYREIESINGHDAFLNDLSKLDAILRAELGVAQRASPRTRVGAAA